MSESNAPTHKKKRIKVTPPSGYAAGLKGVLVALDHTISQMGVARAMRTLAYLNQKKGFDCPGCAWPDPDDKRSLFAEYCENGAKAVAEEATLKRADPYFFTQHKISDMLEWTDYEIGKSGRLTHPMLKKPGADYYEPISWNDAYEIIATELNSLSSPDEAVFYTSGRSSNEAAFLWGLFSRAFGTNNMPDCSNMCHESSGVALNQTVGIGKGSVLLDDIAKAEVVIVIGQNPGTNHPRMLSSLQDLKENGGKVIAINPLEEAGLKRFKNPQHPADYFSAGTVITDIFLQVKINEDVSLLKAILKLMLDKEETQGGVFDHEFIQSKTSGYEDLIADLKRQDISYLIKRSGVALKDVQAAADLLAKSNKIIICWAMGLTQHKNAVDNIKECVNLLLLKGSIGKEGAGTCPVRGHSNVQGDRTVGIIHHSSKELNQALKDAFGFDAPIKSGLDTVEAIQAMYNHKAKVFIALGGNFASAASDTNYTFQALRNCNLTVHISTKLNRSHMVTGNTAIILPTLGRSEKDIKDGTHRFVTVENSMGKVHTSEGHLNPASDELMSEPEIVANIAHSTLNGSVNVNWLELGLDYNKTREAIEKVIKGFDQYNARVKDGFYLPNNTREADFSKMPGGRAQFSICALSNHQLKDDEFLLMTMRSHDQFNTTIYGMHDRYRGVHNERRVIFMNPNDMKKFGLNKLDIIDVESHYDGETRRAEKFYVIPYSIPEQNLAGYFPELNVLIPIKQFADQSQTPISKSVIVRIGKSGSPL